MADALADHDRGDVRIGAGDVGHDAGVGDAQAGEAVDEAELVDNCAGVV
jgi:hypothetical protein